MRSKWKGNFINLKKNNLMGKNSMILNSFLRKEILIHNGKVIEPLIIKREMIGSKIGEFIFTRKIGVLHKKKNKNKMKKKK